MKLAKFIDVKPGEVFEYPSALDGSKHLFLKLENQKAVNTTSWSLVGKHCFDQHKDEVYVVGTFKLNTDP